MAQATYHSNRGDSSALLLIKKHKFEMSPRPAYVQRETLEGHKIGDTIQIPDNFELVDWVDGETGEVRETKGGEPLKVLVFN